MNWEHVRAFLWLQSRIRRNKAKRSGELSRVVHLLARVVAVALAIISFSGLFAVGYFALKSQPPNVILYVWDGVVGVFLMGWLMLLSIELQRSELLPIEKFMHFPISVSGLFLINYVSSILGEAVAMCFFFPAMLGLATGLLFSKGAAMLWLFPLIAAFILMVTAVTYQFRGWLAVLMMNKRHRRNILMMVTFVTMIAFQFPNLSMRFLGRQRVSSAFSHFSQPENLVRNISMVVPLGWVGYGAMSSAEGRFLPPLLGIAGLALISALSLRRSYRTTIRLYTGDYGFGKKRSGGPPLTPVSPAAKAASLPKRSLLEWRPPWISEQTAAVALANFRSITRAPESKMMLISPVILTLFFGASISRWSSNPSEFTRPLIASGVLMMLFLSLSQLWMNQFGFDRNAFRNYVLSAASRRDILLGKNLSGAPLTLGIATAAMALLEWVFPMQIDHFIGVLFQSVTMFLLLAIFANFVSILNPSAITSGSLRPAVRPSGKTLLFGMLFLILYPIAMAPSMIPLGLEVAFHWLDWHARFPVFLVLSAVEVVAAAGLYLWVLGYQGRLLQSREISILEVVAGRTAED